MLVSIHRSRNDIRKLKSELMYSEKRRLHAEEQEELSSRERAQMRDELHELRTRADHLQQVGFFFFLLKRRQTTSELPDGKGCAWTPGASKELQVHCRPLSKEHARFL